MSLREPPRIADRSGMDGHMFTLPQIAVNRIGKNFSKKISAPNDGAPNSSQAASDASKKGGLQTVPPILYASALQTHGWHRLKGVPFGLDRRWVAPFGERGVLALLAITCSGCPATNHLDSRRTSSHVLALSTIPTAIAYPRVPPMRGPRRPSREPRCDAKRVEQGSFCPASPLLHRPQSPPIPAHAARILCAVGTLLLLALPAASAQELNARLRIVWGAGVGQLQPWRGSIAISEGQLTNPLPLGIARDEAAALQLVDNRIQINPLLPRAFDGCDVTVTANPNAELVVRLAQKLPGANPLDPETTPDDADQPPLRIPLNSVLDRPSRVPLAAGQGHLLVSRAPGDQLNVEIDRKSMVFRPEEAWRLRLAPDLPVTADELPLSIEVVLHHAGSEEPLWNTSRPWRPGDEPLDIEITAPALEGAYRLAVTAHARRRLVHRWLLSQPTQPIASRTLELVVVHEDLPVATPINAWTTEWTIDPASPTWWQRLPAWTRVPHLPGMPAPQSLGNVAPLIERLNETTMVGLPTTPPDAEPSWQAYTLPVRRPGWPHAVEISLPQQQQQQLDLCIVEPDAAGRAIDLLRHASTFTDPPSHAATHEDDATPTRRLVFWPRTQTPVLLIANRSKTRPAYYGSIRLEAAAPPPHSAAAPPADEPRDRLIAAYLANPDIIRTFGAQGRFDPVSGLAITDWNMVLTAAQRIANRLKSTGYNAAAICIAADGGSLTPLGLFGNSPRFENGRLASDGADPLPKDTLEALCRVFDREGLRLIPVVQLSAATPALERAIQDHRHPSSGFVLVDHAGRNLRDRNTINDSAAPHYNILNVDVQTQLIEATLTLTRRYAHHPCLAGIGLQLPAAGYGVLPETTWGLDDATFARFADAEGIHLDASATSRFADRRTEVLGPSADAWHAWRQAQLTSFYLRLAKRLKQHDERLRLVLTTEQTFQGRRTENELRKAVAGRGSFTRAWQLAGLDADQLAATPDVLLLRPRRIGSPLDVEHRLVDRHVHLAATIDHLCSASGNDGTLLYYPSHAIELPTFDQQSPFGAANTRVAASATSSPTGHELRRAIVETVAANDWSAFFEGGETWLVADDPERRRLLGILAALPHPDRQTQTEQVQPLTMRVYRNEKQTTVCFINEAPWPIRGHWVADTSKRAEIVELGAAGTPATTLAPGPQSQTLQMKAFDMRAWTIADPQARIEPAVLQATLSAEDDLARQLDLLDARMQNLDIRRPYPELIDPGFELNDQQPTDGWQTRRGPVGDIRYDAPAYAGNHALRLASDDALGVAIQSRSFPAPETGQLIVQAAVRNATPDANVQLHFSVEYQRNGQTERQHRTFGADAPLENAWTVRELAVDDLPLDEGAELRVQFHATGHGEVWIDEVELFDLTFSSDERIELAKRVYAARTAINEGKLLDCQRHIDSYWTQRLVDNVPVPQVALAPPTPKVVPTDPKAGSSRRWLPRLWR